MRRAPHLARGKRARPLLPRAAGVPLVPPMARARQETPRWLPEYSANSLAGSESRAPSPAKPPLLRRGWGSGVLPDRLETSSVKRVSLQQPAAHRLRAQLRRQRTRTPGHSRRRAVGCSSSSPLGRRSTDSSAAKTQARPAKYAGVRCALSSISVQQVHKHRCMQAAGCMQPGIGLVGRAHSSFVQIS